MINASWGGPTSSTALRDAIAAAGIPFVAAAGNDGVDLDVTPSYPAAYSLPNLITVTAVDNRGQRPSWANTGPLRVALAAPGAGIASTVPGGYAYMDGTSMATPFVAAAAALIRSAYPSLDSATVLSSLRTTVRPLSSLSGVTATGGILDIPAELTAAAAAVPAYEAVAPSIGSVTASPNPAVVYSTGQRSVTFTVAVSDVSRIASTEVALVAPSGKSAGGASLSYVSRSGDTEIWRATVGTWTYASEYGRWRVDIRTLDEWLNPATKSAYFYVKGDTKFTFNASPEPAKYNSKLKLAGALKRLNHSGRYVAYKGKRVNFYFKPKGGTYSYVGYTTTNTYGNFTKYVTAKKDGTWRVRFPGTSYYVTKAVGDYVDVY